MRNEIPQRKESDVEIVYLCDREKDCFDSPMCGKECKHTLDPNHAKYGRVENPITSKRFTMKKKDKNKIFFWERDPEEEVESK